MADQTEQLNNTTGLGIDIFDVTQETRPALPEGQGEEDDFVIEEDTNQSEQHAEPLVVLTEHTLASEGDDNTLLQSAFSPDSDENDGDAYVDGAGEGDDEVVNGPNLQSQATNNGLWQPQVEFVEEPYRIVIGSSHPSKWDEIYRENPYERRAMPISYHRTGISDATEYEQMKMALFRGRSESAEVVRPSPLRTASDPDSPISLKNTEPTGDVGALLSPISESQDEHAVSPLSDRELTPSPQTPAPKFATGRDWAEDDPEDISWIDEAIGSIKSSPRDPENNLEQIPEDAGNGAPSNQQPSSPVSPIEPVSAPGLEMIVHGSDPVDEAFNKPEASEYDVQTSQQNATAPDSFDPVFVGAEDHHKSKKEKSPTSPDFFGPEPLTGLTPQEGIEAWWYWRERNRPNHRSFRTNRNLWNQDGAGDLNPTRRDGDDDKSEAKKYLAAQRLDAQQLVNIQQENIQAMARRSYALSEAIKFDLKSSQEYIKLRMLKYRYERNQYYQRFVDSQQRVGRRDQEIHYRVQEINYKDREIDKKDEKLHYKDAEIREVKRQLDEVNGEYDRMAPVLQEEREKRQRLKIAFQELKVEYRQQSAMYDAYQRAAQSSGEDLRNLRAQQAKRIASLGLSSVIEVASQEPVPEVREKPKQPKRAAPLQFSSIMEVVSQEPVPDAKEKPRQPKRAAPLTLWSFSNVASQDANKKLQYNCAERARRAALLQRSSIREEFLRNPEPSEREDPVSDAIQRPKSAPPSYRPRRSPPLRSPASPSFPRSRRPAPEHAANWPLVERPRLVDFMTRWINKNREWMRNSTQTPLQKAQLDKILGLGFLSWDQLIEELRRIGFTIRPDHLALALANPDNILTHGLPQPNLAVQYASRGLTEDNAVRRLMEEISALQRELSSLRMPHEHFEDLENMTRLKENFEKEAQTLDENLDEALEEAERLRKALSDSHGIKDFGSQADQKEIQKLKAELEVTQQTLAEVLSDNVKPDALTVPQPVMSATVLDQSVLDKIMSAQDERQTASAEREFKLAMENGKLDNRLVECRKHGELLRSDLNDVNQKLSDSRANYTTLHKTTRKEIASLEARLTACGNHEAGDTKSSSAIEAKLAICHEHGKLLESNIEDLTKKLSDSRSEVADLEAKLAAHDNGKAGNTAAYQEGDATGDRTQVEALKKKVSELEQELAASRSQNELTQQLVACRSYGKKLQDHIEELELELEVQSMQQQGDAGSHSDLSERLKAAEQHVKDLQEKVDELQLQPDAAKKDTPQPSKAHVKKILVSIKETKAHRDILEVQMMAKHKGENAVLHEALKKSQHVILELQEQARSQEEPLPTDEPASVYTKPAVKKSEGSGDIAILRREFAEIRDKNEQLEREKTSLRNYLEAAQSDLNALREQVKPGPREEPTPASGHGSISSSKRVDNDNAPSQAGHAQSASADGSVVDLESFVLGQSDSESEETSEEDTKDNFGLSTTTREKLKRAYVDDLSYLPSEHGLSTRSNMEIKKEDEQKHITASENANEGPSSGSSAFSSDLDFVTDIKARTPSTIPKQELVVASPEASPIQHEPAVDDHVCAYPWATEEVLGMYSPLSTQPATGLESLPDSHTQAPSSLRHGMLEPYSPVEYDDEDDDEDEIDDKRLEELAGANAWLQEDNKEAWDKVKALEKQLGISKRPKSDIGVKTPLPAAGEPAPPPTQSQQPPLATKTEMKTRAATRTPRPLPAAREPVPLPEDPAGATEMLSAAQIARRTEMLQSPTFIADAERRRAIRERLSVQQQERIRRICRRAAAIFGEEDLPYVPVEKRYKPMVRVQ